MIENNLLKIENTFQNQRNLTILIGFHHELYAERRKRAKREFNKAQSLSSRFTTNPFHHIFSYNI